MNTAQKSDQAWRAVPGNLMTKWAQEVNPEAVLPEYPRPQMTREHWMNLNGLWNYAIRPRGETHITQYDGRILVPFSIESSLSGVKKELLPRDRLWYHRTFSVPKEWSAQRILLHFGAVDWEAEVRVNHHTVGIHTGGYYPFTMDISSYLMDGDNELTVIVWDPTDTFGQERGKQSLKPQGLFYTPVSGIWQTVWIEPVPQQYIRSIRLTPDLDAGELTVSLETGDDGEQLDFEAQVYDQEICVVSGRSRTNQTLRLPLPNAMTWSPEAPYLYDLTLKLINDNKTIDSITSYFGMRKFSIERDQSGLKRLLLNGEPLFQNGILDQGYWPDGLYTAPTDAALEFDIITAKELGFNMIRKHIKVEPARWYYHCDRHGMIVWQDMINGGSGWNHLHHLLLPNLARSLHVKDTSPAVYKALGRKERSNRDNYCKELQELIDTLYNVTSIGMWVPFNEAWGQFDAAKTANWLHSYDPTRWVDHASGWHDQRVGEIKSIHVYFRKLKMPKKILDRTVVISEYGGYSLQETGHVWREDKAFGYRKFKSRQELNSAYASLIQGQLQPLISKGVAAAVYTQLTDVETETNGILTYDRELIKLDVSLLKSLHQALLTP